jgi:hypothetical protein
VDDLLNGGVRLRELDHVGRERQAALHFIQDLVGLNPERARQPRAAADHVAGKLQRGAVDVAEPDRLAIAVQDRSDVGEIDRIVANIELVVAEFLDEITQAEAVEVVARKLLRRSPVVHGILHLHPARLRAGIKPRSIGPHSRRDA